MSQTPTIGRIVHFTMPDNQVRPAIVVRVHDKQEGQPQKVNLQVLTDGPNDPSTKDSPMWKSEVMESPTSEQACWHWPAKE